MKRQFVSATLMINAGAYWNCVYASRMSAGKSAMTRLFTQPPLAIATRRARVR
jgi:hypothetical protein